MTYGQRTWMNGKMYYPFLLTVQVNINENTAHMITRCDNETIHIDDYMSLSPFTAVNGPIFEEDIVTNGSVVGKVAFDKNQGAYVVEFKTGSVLFSTMGKTKILGNSYENPELLDIISEKPKCYLQQMLKDKENLEKEDSSSEEDEEEKRTISIVNTYLYDEEDLSYEDEDIEQFSPEDMFEEELERQIEAELEEEVNQEVEEPEDEMIELEAELQEELADNDPYLEGESKEEVEEAEEEVQIDDVKLVVASYKGKESSSYAYSVFINGSLVKGKGGIRHLGDVPIVELDRYALDDALSSLKMDEANVVIESNCKYSMQPLINKWVNKWEEDGWKKSDGKPVKDVSRWSSIMEGIHKYEPTLNYVAEPSEYSELHEMIKNLKKTTI